MTIFLTAIRTFLTFTMHIFLFAKLTISKYSTSLESSHLKLEVISIFYRVSLLRFGQFTKSFAFSVVTATLAQSWIITAFAALWTLRFLIWPLRQFSPFSVHYFTNIVVFSLLIETKPIVNLLNEFFLELPHHLLVVTAQKSINFHSLLCFPEGSIAVGT